VEEQKQEREPVSDGEFEHKESSGNLLADEFDTIDNSI